MEIFVWLRFHTSFLIVYRTQIVRNFCDISENLEVLLCRGYRGRPDSQLPGGPEDAKGKLTSGTRGRNTFGSYGTTLQHLSSLIPCLFQVASTPRKVKHLWVAQSCLDLVAMAQQAVKEEEEVITRRTAEVKTPMVAAARRTMVQ